MYTDMTPGNELGKRFAEPWGQLVWHADGTPWSSEEYIKGGLPVPTPEQIEDYIRVTEERRQEKLTEKRRQAKA